MSSLSWIMDRKVWMGGVAGLLTALLVWLAGLAGYEVPVGIQSSLPVVIGYAVSYLVPQSLRDIISRVNNHIVKLATADPENPTTAVVVPAAVTNDPVAVSAAVSAGIEAAAAQPQRFPPGGPLPSVAPGWVP